MALTDYERYQFEWMIDHGHSLGELVDELTGLQNDLEEEPGVNLSVRDVFDAWEDERGFGGELFACEAEWRGAEGKELEEERGHIAELKAWLAGNPEAGTDEVLDAVAGTLFGDGSMPTFAIVSGLLNLVEQRPAPASREDREALIGIALNARGLDEALEEGDSDYILDCATLAANAHIDIREIAKAEGWEQEFDRRIGREFGTITKDMVRDGIEHGIIRFEANPDPTDPWKTMCCVGEDGGLFYFVDTTDIPVSEYIRMNQNNLDMVVDDVWEALNDGILRYFPDDYERYASILSEPHEGGTSSLTLPENMDLQAVGVGCCFNLFDTALLIGTGIDLKETGTVVTVDGRDYPLMKGASYEDSRVVDALLDSHGEKRIDDYRKQPQGMSLKQAAREARSASDALTKRKTADDPGGKDERERFWQTHERHWQNR